ncbi:flavodoxin family protein [Ruminococcaceae bacterium OttesenSCG-928-L11]|nr:flavodoxin family protein [Ruminococcaceae bacterium OttesenSCG-928-L11]
MGKKLLLIKGGPRANGVTNQMLESLRQQASASGWECSFYDIYEMPLMSCTGCRTCRKTGICIMSDDVSDVRKQLLECDVVALAAPTYFANVPEPVKNLFDRLSGAVLDENAKPKQNKEQQYILLTACATKPPFDILAGQSTGAIRAMKEFFKMAGMKNLGKVVCAGASPDKQISSKTKSQIGSLMP